MLLRWFNGFVDNHSSHRVAVLLLFRRIDAVSRWPNALDQKIVREAAAILSIEAAWNRADNRECPTSATTWSIYCALEKATFDVTGGFHHRRPALEVVREIVDERAATRNYHHRLMDYNNDPTRRSPGV
jgi:hypothetical protein